MESFFTRSFFEHNRQQLRKQVGDTDPIVISANGLLQRSNDTTFPFHQNPDFWYLTGIDEPDIILCMLADETFLIVPGRSAVRAFFDGAVDASSLTKRSGISVVLDERAGWDKLRTALSSAARICTHIPKHAYEPGHGMYLNPAQRRVTSKLKRLTTGEVKDIIPTMSALRVIKQPAEIAALEAAVTITHQTINELRSEKVLAGFAAENELEAAIGARFRQAGATGHGYSPIIAGGTRATTLHYVDNNAPLKSNEFIVIDVGAEVEHYSADITRTLIATEPTHRQQEVLEAVLHVQAFALNLLKPGTLIKDYERAVHREMGKSLMKLGLISDALDSRQIWQYYPHATSHFLGLDVHDVGDYSQPLAPGMVLTCEPGIYIVAEGIGVRIEDDVLITETGNRVLGTGCSYQPYTV